MDINVQNGQTQYNTVLNDEIVKIHGDPTMNHHDWVVVEEKGNKFCVTLFVL